MLGMSFKNLLMLFFGILLRVLEVMILIMFLVLCCFMIVFVFFLCVVVMMNVLSLIKFGLYVLLVRFMLCWIDCFVSIVNMMVCVFRLR